jgi:ABC-type multidrug transport system fused ATPase/permease subunit
MPSRHDLPAEYSLNEFDSTYLLQDSKLYVVSQDSVKSAEELLYDVHSTQRNAVFTVFKILKPVIPKYLCSLLFMIMARAFEAPLYAHYLPSFKSSIAAINPEATEGEFGHGPTIFAVAQEHAIIFAVGFLLMRPVDFIANSLGDQAACDFAAPLRKAVMQAIMKQDTQYFDFNPTAKLQERLNRDTDELVENLLWMPRNFLQHFFRVCQRGITLYVVAPRMFYACATMNVPMFALIILFTSEPLRKLLDQRDLGARNSSAETLEILQNIRTVRQFSMEKQEKEKYMIGNLSRTIFENRIRDLVLFFYKLLQVYCIITYLF